MSPTSTFQSWGNSSVLVFRIHFPSLVIRGVAPGVNAGAVCFWMDMERNFKSVNGLPFLPILVCRKIAGPVE